jgi:cytochrome P450
MAPPPAGYAAASSKGPATKTLDIDMAPSPSIPLRSVSRLRSLMDSRHKAGNLVELFNSYTASLGNSFVFHFGGLKPAIVSTDPVVLEHVLKANAENYQKSELQMKRMRHFLGPGLLTFHGEQWRKQRRLIHQGGFSTTKLAGMVAMMHQSLAESLERFDRRVQNGPVDIYSEMMNITFRMVSRSLFSASIKDDDVDYISETILIVQEFMLRQVVQPYLDPWFIISGELRKHERMRDRVDQIVLDYVRQRRMNPGQFDDLLQTLMDVVYSETGEGMSDESIMHESLQLLVAGHETSSNALCWTLYLLSQYPEYAAKIRNEYNRVLGTSTLQYADLPKLDCATQVVEESLRLYPPFWMVDRVAVADDRAGELAIPKGTIVVVFIYGAHHSARFWHNPESFIPERFSKENRKNLIPFTYLPFGGGPRGCIGGNYAMLQMLMILGAILRRYDFELEPGQNISPHPMVILRPKNGIKMKFARRSRPEPAVL